ncbi:MAG TPA: VOC family protein [Solirubrobacteraceae bacterium]|nr:VOC family protein [Solirubrobacteraceae bacterium]
MIAGAHVIVFAEDAEAARAFLRDVLGLRAIDSGDGWLIFALPPTELAIHPGAGWGLGQGQHLLFLMCHDVHATVAELEARGVEFVAPVTDEGYGLVTRFKVPGAGEMGLYQPAHPSPLEAFGGP